MVVTEHLRVVSVHRVEVKSGAMVNVIGVKVKAVEMTNVKNIVVCNYSPPSALVIPK